jgi:hypothetical protein
VAVSNRLNAIYTGVFDLPPFRKTVSHVPPSGFDKGNSLSFRMDCNTVSRG